MKLYSESEKVVQALNRKSTEDMTEYRRTAVNPSPSLDKNLKVPHSKKQPLWVAALNLLQKHVYLCPNRKSAEKHP